MGSFDDSGPVRVSGSKDADGIIALNIKAFGRGAEVARLRFQQLGQIDVEAMRDGGQGEEGDVVGAALQ